MPANDYFGLPTTILSRIGVVHVDAVIEEVHRFSNLVTEHPVEDGSPRTDHIVNLPVKLEMEGRITDTPSTASESLITGAAGLVSGALGVPPIITVLGQSLANLKLPGRAKAAYQELVSLYESRNTFSVLTGINEYINMVFASLEFPRRAEDGRSIRFKASMTEILVIGVDPLTNAERIADNVANTAVKPINRGRVAMQILSPGIGI